MDVTVQILDEFARDNGLPRNALEDVLAHAIAERDRRRAVMLHRLRRVNTEKLSRRLEEASIVVAGRDSGRAAGMRRWPGWATGQAAARRSSRRARCTRPSRLHAVRSPRRSCATRWSWSPTRHAPVAAGQDAEAAKELSASSTTAGHREHVAAVAGAAAGATGSPRRGLEGDCRNAGRRVPGPPRPLHQTGPGARAARYVHGNYPPPCPLKRRGLAPENGRGLARRGARRRASVAVLELNLIRHGIAAERGPDYPDYSKRPVYREGHRGLNNKVKALDALICSFDAPVDAPDLVTCARSCTVESSLAAEKPPVALK